MSWKIIDSQRIVNLVSEGPNYTTEKFIISLARIAEMLDEEVPTVLIDNELKILIDRAIALHIILNKSAP